MCVFSGATWRIHPDLDVGVYPITPRSRAWQVHAYNDIYAKRTSFFLIPDFGSTAHMCQGQTLDAAFVDPMEAWAKVHLDMQIAVYVMLSRVKRLASLVLMQPFSPWLFRQGALPGPNILMKKLRGEVNVDEVKEEFAKAESAREQRTGAESKRQDPM